MNSETQMLVAGLTQLRPSTDDELLVASVACLTCGFALCFLAYRTPQSLTSVFGGILFGLFCLNAIVPQFGHDGFLCYLVGAWVSVIGAVVGMTVSLLATWAAVGTCLGCLVGIFLVLADREGMFADPATISVLFALLIATCLAISWFKVESCTIVTMAAAGGFLVASGMDLLLDARMVIAVSRILQMSWPEQRRCWRECHLPDLLLLWGSTTTLGVAVQGHMSGLLPSVAILRMCGLRRSRDAYERLSGHTGEWVSKGKGVVQSREGKGREGSGSEAWSGDEKPERPARRRKTWTYTSNYQTSNYFDMEDLPYAMNSFKDKIFNAAETLAGMFGFQDDSVRNQVEHALTLLSNHRRYANENPSLLLGEGFEPPRSAIHSFHQKLFMNYRDWCEAMRIAPHFVLQATAPPDLYEETHQIERDALSMDIMLWLCIWGEAANLRHMPECLCFIFHKMMQEFILLQSTSYSMLYSGYFLDHVVTPIYEVVTRKRNDSGDHESKLNYDDFNEFFWTPSCLRYSYRSDDVVDAPVGGNVSPARGKSRNSRPGDNIASVAMGMESAPKTFLEKRSIFSALLCFHRVVEFHVVSFQVCAVIAFARMMVWDVAYSLQMMSTVFWSINFLGIVWTSLEVWQAFPGIRITGMAKCGFLMRLFMRFLILVYQSLYFMWSTQRKPKVSDSSMQGAGGYVFWWWQYLWLSFVAMAPHVLEMWQQIFPPIATWLCLYDSDYLQALLNICYPLSRIYVGKRVDVSVGSAMRYMLFWGSLLSWKLWFSYNYEVLILVLPSVQLYDDYVNYPGTSYWGMFFLILLRWVPQMCIFFIDTSIWFACWSAIGGTIVGFQERLGEIHDFPSVRSHFMQLPGLFCSKVICPGASSRDTSTLDMAEPSSLSVGGLGRCSDGGDFGSLTGDVVPTEATHLLTNVESGISRSNRSRHTREVVQDFLDLRMQKWAAFAAVWNEVINNMRHSDVISNAEKSILKFHSFAGFTKPVYLPIFQTAGSVEVAVNLIQDHVAAFDAEEDPTRRGHHEAALRRKIAADITMNEALSEVWELGVWIVRSLLGPKHDTDVARTVQILDGFIESKQAMFHLKLQDIKAIVTDATAIFSTLHHALPKRNPSSPRPTEPQDAAGGDQSSSGGAVELSKGATIAYGQVERMLRPEYGSIRKSISTGRLSELGACGGSGVEVMKGSGGGGCGGGSSGLPKAGRRQGVMMGTRLGSSTGHADNTRDDVRDKLRALLMNIRNMVKATDERATEVVGRVSYMTSVESGFMWDDAYASQRLDRMAEDKTALSILEKLHGLLGIDRNDAEPNSVEARRRLTFFANSLFMDMPRAPPVSEMLSWTCMTPFYCEDVVYRREDLERENEDGLTTLMYLQALYKHDWRNFMERKGITTEQQAMSKKHMEGTRLWASFRAQTLARTVEGMMYYEAALRLLARLERVRSDQVNELVQQKFQYVVACQVYGHMKKSQDPKADDIEMLLRRFPSLRVAYIDEVRISRDRTEHGTPGMEYFSVLIKGGQAGGESGLEQGIKTGGGVAATEGTPGIQEVYRVKLPGNPVFGEGKPENQNHAIIFTRGEHLQAIDMNQEGYFEEALKMRCLLQEFRRGTSRRPTVIVGFREHIFTGSVSSLANYMALQELSFVTLGQRVLNNPLRVRMHYGHPDLFDKVFYMTAGGISKASKGINLSEDVFAGYNGTIRGGQVHFSEFVQVGKGRDVGMQQIYKFEAKLSQGAAEQTLSRDVNRLGDRLDFFRLLSFYFGGLGYYVGNFITVLTVTYVVYFNMMLAVFDSEAIGDRKIIPEGNLQMILAGMGILNTMPILATIMVEKGLLASLGEVLQVFLTGGPMYFMFHIQTRAHYFYQTVLAGGAQYRATGRGFVTHHSRFDDLYRFFANSHFYLGFELMVALIMTALTTSSKQYLARTWSLWLACISFLFAPFWFNPLSFHWGKVVQDYGIWMKWMAATGGSSSNSWEVWWREENWYLARFSLTQKMQKLVRPLIYLVVGYGIGGPRLLSLKDHEIKVILKWLCLAVALTVASKVNQGCGERLAPWLRRSSTILITSFAVGYGAYLMLMHTKYMGLVVGLYYVTAALNTVALLMGYRVSRYAGHLHDFIIGHLFFAVLFLLSALQFPSTVQTWLLFHNALSEGVVIDDILKYARMNKELAGVDDDTLEEDTELKRLVRAQAAELEILKERIVASGGGQCLGVSRGSGRDGAISTGVLGSTPSGSLAYDMGTLPDSGSPESSGAPPAAEEAPTDVYALAHRLRSEKHGRDGLVDGPG